MKAEIGKILQKLYDRKAIEMISQSYTYADWYTIQIQCIRNCWIFEKKLSYYFNRHTNEKYKLWE